MIQQAVTLLSLMSLPSRSAHYGLDLNRLRQAHVLTFILWLGKLWSFVAVGSGWLSPGTGHHLCFLVCWDANTCHFMLPSPQTEPLLHCGLPRWTEISLQRSLGHTQQCESSQVTMGRCAHHVENVYSSAWLVHGTR